MLQLAENGKQRSAIDARPDRTALRASIWYHCRPKHSGSRADWLKRLASWVGLEPVSSLPRTRSDVLRIRLSNRRCPGRPRAYNYCSAPCPLSPQWQERAKPHHRGLRGHGGKRTVKMTGNDLECLSASLWSQVCCPENPVLHETLFGIRVSWAGGTRPNSQREDRSVRMPYHAEPVGNDKSCTW